MFSAHWCGALVILCDLNGSVRGRVFQLEEEVLDTSEPLFRSVQTQNIIVFILVLYANRVDCIHCLNKPGNRTMQTLPN